MLDIEVKEDSAEKLASVQGKPTKYYLFSREFNAIVQKINEVYLGQKKKIENTRYKSTLSGENVIIPFQAAGQSHYSVTHAALVSVAGFTTAGLTTTMYEGQDVIFENQTGHDITLKDSFGADTSFVIGADLIVPNEGKIWFRFRNNELELIDKNWFGIQEVVTPENLGEFIDGLDAKTNIKDDDGFILTDSEDSLKSKKTRFLDIKTKLKSYFDTFYLSLSVFDDFVTDFFDSLDNKLDKSITDSSVYGTDAAGDQTMIPLSELGGDLKILHKNHVSGVSVVNNPNFTYKYAYGVLIPGGTIQVGDFIDIEVSFEKVSGGNAELYPRIGINTINGTAGETVISYTYFASNAVYAKIQRSLVVKATALTEILHHGTSSGTSWNAAATTGNKPIDWSTDKYVIISIANSGASALDATWRVSSIIITKK